METFSNKRTGEVLELPPPAQDGSSPVLLNGRIVERVKYSDACGGMVTTASGGTYFGEEWAHYIAKMLESGGWSERPN